MGFMDDFAGQVARVTIGALPEAATQRLAAIYAVKGVMPEADVYDRIRLARYVLTDSEDAPEPRDDPYPHASGDVTVLGPGIFSSTPAPDNQGVVINWLGVNFVPQREHGEFVIHDLTKPPEDHPDDPGPTAPPEEPSGELPEIDPSEPAPMAGTHWQGHRGGSPR